ncbi:hypothetical protein KI387_040422, partial [Taxus chinensis]
VKMEKAWLLQLYELPYFGKPEHLYQWLMSWVHEEYFHFTGRKMLMNPQLISQFTGLICEGDNLEDYLGNKYAIQETITKYACKKGSQYYEISGIKELVMKMVVHL